MKFLRSQAESGATTLDFDTQMGSLLKPLLECTYCGKQFPFASKLREHIRMHTGERPYSCPLCPYEAARSHHLRRHLLGVHSNVPNIMEIVQESK